MLPITDNIGYVWNCPMCSWKNGHIWIQINEQENITCFHWRCSGQFCFQKPINLFRQRQHFVWCCNQFELNRLTHLKKNVKQKYLGQILFWPVSHSNLMKPKGLHDIWVSIKLAQRGKFILGIGGFSSYKISGTEPDYPNEGWTSPNCVVNSLKSVKPSKDEFSLRCLNTFFSVFHFALTFSFPAYSSFLTVLFFSLCFFKKCPFFPFYLSILCVIFYIVNVTWVNSAKY